jgi:hypothetical protein
MQEFTFVNRRRWYRDDRDDWRRNPRRDAQYAFLCGGSNRWEFVSASSLVSAFALAKERFGPVRRFLFQFWAIPEEAVSCRTTVSQP